MEEILQHLKNIKLKIIEKVQAPLEVVQRVSTEYCNNSNIHGVRYFAKRTLHWSERLWWMIAFSLSLWLCGSMIHNSWREWNDVPMKFEAGEKMHISMLPFPTLTICPDIKNLKHKFDISSKFKRIDSRLINYAPLSDNERLQYHTLAHICPTFPDIHRADDFLNKSVYSVIEDIAPNLDYAIKLCRWQQRKINCSQYISPTLTNAGLCFTFNALNFYDTHTDEVAPTIVKNIRNSSNWSLEKGYKTGFNEIEYPYRVFQSGEKGSLALILTSNAKDYDSMCISRKGFEIGLTSPSESLESQYLSYIDFSEDTQVTVKPMVTTTSNGLRNYDPTQRDCFYNSERKLRFFRAYTKLNCLTECLANFTKKICGCAKLSMPRDVNTHICGRAKIDCYKEVEVNFRNNDEMSFRKKCNCLQSCEYITYEAKLDRVKFIINESETNTFENNSKIWQIRLTIFFDEDYIETKIRVETLTFSDFFAICGGLLGLFLGISLLSIIELIYYTTLHLFWSKAEYKEEQPDDRETDIIHVNRNAFTNQNRTVQKFFDFISDTRAFIIKVCDDSNIHGVRYFSERMLHWSERLWWLIAFGVSLWLCSSMIHDAWIKWIEDPVTYSYTEQPESLSSIPMPTITVCAESKTIKQKFDVTAALNSLSNLSDIEMTRLNALAHVCPLLPHLVTFKDNFTDESIYDTIQYLAPNISESAQVCYWRDKETACSTLWTPIFTDDGFCFTFNALSSREIYTDQMAPNMMIVKNNFESILGWTRADWSLETGGYRDKNSRGNYPYQATHYGRVQMITLIPASYQKDIERQCRGCDTGFKIILSIPGEIVDTSQNYLRLPMLEQLNIRVKAKLTRTSDGLRGYTPNQRQCYFNSDNPLRFFKIYTKINCEAECLSNFTKIECECVKFSMPRDKYTKICGAANIQCYKSAKWNLFTTENGRIFHEKCNCLPSCTSLEYEPMRQRTTIPVQNTSENMKYSLFGLLCTGSVDLIKRKEMYSFSDILAVCGGLLGLFLGVSFLSIVELIYYATLRLFWTIRMKRNNH